MVCRLTLSTESSLPCPRIGRMQASSRRPLLARSVFVAWGMAVSCLIPTAAIAATLDGGFEVSVMSGSAEARVHCGRRTTGCQRG